MNINKVEALKSQINKMSDEWIQSRMDQIKYHRIKLQLDHDLDYDESLLLINEIKKEHELRLSNRCECGCGEIKVFGYKCEMQTLIKG